MRVADLMNRRAAAIVPSATMQRAAELLVLTQVDLCVVDHDNRFLGIVSEGDLIRAPCRTLTRSSLTARQNAQTLEIFSRPGGASPASRSSA